MPRVLFLSLMLLLANVVSAAALPPCRGGDESKWQDCEGTLMSASGKEYVGVFKDGIFEGENAEGTQYVGEFKDGTMNGQATATNADGRKYVGEHRDGGFHGQGTVTVADGSKYVGEFRDSLPNASSSGTAPNGQINTIKAPPEAAITKNIG